MDQKALDQFDELWQDEAWCLLRDEETPGGLLIFHAKSSVLKLVEDSILNQKLCKRLLALGRPVIDELP
jgi:hypothetical protein